MLVSAVQQSESVLHIHIATLVLDSFPIYIITEHCVEVPVLYSRSLLVIYYFDSGVSTLIPIFFFLYSVERHLLLTFPLFESLVLSI